MNDEFEVNVEDDSGTEVAAKIVGLRKMTLQGDFAMVDEMYAKWRERQARGGDSVNFLQAQNDDEDKAADEESSSEDEDVGGDVEMGEAPELVKAAKEKPAPRIDEDGFTEVIGKKKR